jgi:hypothetical protein
MSLRKISFAVVSIIVLAIGSPAQVKATSAACLPIENNIIDLQGELLFVQQELQSAPTGAKARLVAEARRLNKQIASEKSKLATCKAQNP